MPGSRIEFTRGKFASRWVELRRPRICEGQRGLSFLNPRLSRGLIAFLNFIILAKSLSLRRNEMARRGALSKGCQICRQRKIKVQRLLWGYFLELTDSSVTKWGRHVLLAGKLVGNVLSMEIPSIDCSRTKHPLTSQHLRIQEMQRLITDLQCQKRTYHYAPSNQRQPQRLNRGQFPPHSLH